MIGLRSLRNRLAVVFGLIVLGAIGTIYLTVTPRLEERLRNQKLESLQTDARRYVDGRFGFAAEYKPLKKAPLQQGMVESAAAGTSAEVLILDKLESGPASLVAQLDSAPEGGVDEDDVLALALEAVSSRRRVSATQPTIDVPHAVVA
jgi:hypothetical protein